MQTNSKLMPKLLERCSKVCRLTYLANLAVMLLSCSNLRIQFTIGS